MKNDQIIEHIKKRYAIKKVLRSKREQTLKDQDEALTKMLPIYQAVSQNGYVSAKSLATMDRKAFTSVLPHLAYNFLQDTKLSADFVDFLPERTADTPERRSNAMALSDIGGLIRREGSYEEANDDAKEDLIRGECYIYHDLVKSQDGESMEKICYKHIPWGNVYPEYKSKDTLIVANLTSDDYISIYGQEMFDKVGLGVLLGDQDDLEDKSESKLEGEDIVQVVIYTNPATKKRYEVHGAGKVIEKLEKEEYPYVDEVGRAFNPLKRKIFYKPLNGFHGWGVFDFLIPLARTETTIINAGVHSAVEDAAPITMISTDGDPNDEQRRYKQHLANRSRGGLNEPFFMRNTSVGSRPSIDQLGTGNKNNTVQFWSDWALNQATIYTRIDFRVLINYAPTAEQQGLRKQEQDNVNRAIIERNANTDKKMALEDLYILKDRENDFNDLTILVTPSVPATASLEDIEAMKDDMGDLPKKEETIREVLERVSDYRYDIEPRLDGALDDMSFAEIQAANRQLQMTTPGTVAFDKLYTYIVNKQLPKANIKYGESSRPAGQPEQALAVPPATEGQ